ncbi:MAG: 2Fe-2S iron-sulfur cluster-binding protein, partial [Candidatus Omnitrophota bacterium]
MDKHRITFYPEGRSIEVGKGKTLLAAAISLGIDINSGCAGDGVCGRCKVVVRKGRVAALPTGRISADERKRGIYLACLTTALSDLEVDIPETSRLGLSKVSDEEAFLSRLKGVYSRAEDIEKAGAAVRQELFVHSPLATKIYLELPPPNPQDRLSDLERLYRAIRQVKDVPIMQT